MRNDRESTEMAHIYCFSLEAPFDQTSQFADLLSEMGNEHPPAVSIHETGNPLIWGLDAYFETEPHIKDLTALLETTHLPLPELKLRQLPNRDWVSIVQSEMSPVKAGRYFIHGSHDRKLAGIRAGDIEIDAGQAFGTAHHGTTRGCLLALDQLFKKQRRDRFKNLLDLGTGTGLLAIAAAKVLRHKVLASDIDPVSVRIANENAVLNNVGPLLKTIEADGIRHPTLQNAAPYDLLIANILAAPLRSLASDIQNCMRPGGQLVLSGLLQTQSRSIEACYHQRGFRLVERLPLDEWMTLILQYR